jgi:hypothetical protein
VEQEIDEVVVPGGARLRDALLLQVVSCRVGLWPASKFAAAQAQLLLQLHNPPKGYAVEEASRACYRRPSKET